MESAGIIQIVLAAMGAVAAVLLGVWGIVARYDSRLRDRIDARGTVTSRQLGELRDRIDAQGKEMTEQLRERMAKLEGLLEGLREAITGKRAA